ncbi:rhamnulose-1-phosphate aldolase [Adlercreutzia sp. ZJ154]|uniref:rhamnulose-1-phosphate aldolase n=1 Tax=Adlercreutzia sp. ZJ154 TaxID=2709790 RepID=UPI0013EC4514|nr:rhamnulose-1-phosphate aldolase [Adlercreutzia sp. ZJ154]
MVGCVEQTPFMRAFVRMATDSWNQGWHERNGGNLSYRIPEDEIDSILGQIEYGEWKPLGITAPNVAGEFFLITAAGSYFRNIADDISRCAGIIQIDGSGASYRQCWGFAGGGHPTSELPTHIMNHEVKKLATCGANRVIHHAHPANIVALTFVLPLTSEAFTHKLWQMISECAMVFPEGVGVLSWGVPGSMQLAENSAELMKRVNAVVWAHHGLFCAGNTFDEAFGLMHTIEKAASILVKVLSMVGCGGQFRQTITDANLHSLADAYNLDLADFA